jgi:predicted Zn-dependent protease
MELEKFNEAASSFEELIRKNPDYTQAYYFLAKAYNSQGRKTGIHYLLGIYYKKKGELKNAVFHLERALKNVKDSEKERKIKEMIKEVRKKMKRSRKGG